MTTLGDFKATSIDGREVDLADYEGQVVLVVNTARETAQPGCLERDDMNPNQKWIPKRSET